MRYGFHASPFPVVLSANGQLSLQQVAPGGTITGTGSPFPATGYSSYQEPEEEPEPVR